MLEENVNLSIFGESMNNLNFFKKIYIYAKIKEPSFLDYQMARLNDFLFCSLIEKLQGLVNIGN
jgi:hypothetical protein